MLGKHFVFLDSFLFMSSSHDKLGSNLSDKAFKYIYQKPLKMNNSSL